MSRSGSTVGKVVSVSEVEEIAVPEQIGWDALTKILVAYLKAGGEKEKVSGQAVQQISNVSQGNISVNNKFFVSLGLLEGETGQYKLTEAGVKYTKALDWGRIDEAKTVLAQTIKDKPLVKRTLSYVDLNKPVTEDDLVAKIATIAGVTKESRFSTGIRGFVDMLSTSGLLHEDSEGRITISKKDIAEQDLLTDKRTVATTATESSKRTSIAFPVTFTINVDQGTDVAKVKAVVKAIREALSEV